MDQKLVKFFLFVLMAIVFAAPMSARELTLEECRKLAIQNNKELKMASAEEQAAYYEQKAAFTKYFPRVNASGTYMRTSKEISLLSNDQKHELSNIGSAVSSLHPALEVLAPQLNGVGQGLVDALHTDTRNLTALGVMLTQPIYMGGKIRAYNQITQYAAEIARNKNNLALQDVIVEVDETYWRIVELQAKQKLALSYKDLVDTLCYNVEALKAEGFATQADVLSVKVKVNEAEVTIIQVENGLSISKMLLCQICGIDIDTPISVSDNAPAMLDESLDVEDEVRIALERRPELKSLSLAASLYDEKVKVARSEFLPSVALTGGYAATNPSLFNGFHRKLDGMWSIGVVANIPIITSGERFYKVRAAKAEALKAKFQLEEVQERVELQVHQSQQRVLEAEERVRKARKSQEQADENLRYAQLGLAEGVIPVSNVIEAQTAWLSAYSEAITAKIDLHMANIYLRKATGTIGY